MEKRNFRKVNFYKESKPEPKELVFGIRSIEETLKSGKEFEKVFFEKGQPNLHELLQEVKKRNIPYSLVPAEKLNSLTRKNHQGVVAFTSPINYSKIDNIVIRCFEEGKSPLILILDRVTDVRNFGAIARTAECAGVDAIVVPSKGSALISADALKTSSGALNYIPVCREDNLKDTLTYLKDSGLQIIACTEKSDDYPYKTDFKAPTAIILGSEEDGISPEYLKKADKKVKIPLYGQVESLNVSVAAAVVIYEAVRQRL